MPPLRGGSGEDEDEPESSSSFTAQYNIFALVCLFCLFVLFVCLFVCFVCLFEKRNLRAALASLLKTTFLLSFLAFSLKFTTSLEIFKKVKVKAYSTFLEQSLDKLVGLSFTWLVFHLPKFWKSIHINRSSPAYLRIHYIHFQQIITYLNSQHRRSLNRTIHIHIISIIHYIRYPSYQLYPFSTDDPDLNSQ